MASKKSNIPTNLPCTAELSCDMDLIYVDSSYTVLMSQILSTAVIMKVDGFPITPEAYHIDCKGITGASHTIAEDGVVTVMFPEGTQVLKNSQIIINAIGHYKTSTQVYSADAIMKIMPVVTQETVRMVPSAARFKCNEYGNYTPVGINVSLERNFAGQVKTESYPYKSYDVRYTFGDDPYNELEFPALAGISDLKSELKGRVPDHIMLNLYNTSVDNIPIQSIRIPIVEVDSDGNTMSSGIKVVLDNENDCIMTNSDYMVTTARTLQTRLAFYLGGRQIPFKTNDIAEVSIKTVDPEEENLLKDLVMTTEIVEETGELAIKYKFAANMYIPKKMVNEWTVKVTDTDKSVYTGKCIFNINAIPGMQSIYQMKTNGSVIRVNQANGKRGPSTIICEKFKWTGDLHEPTDYGFILWSKDHGDPHAYEMPVVCDDVEECLILEYYGNDGILLDQQTIHVIYDARIAPDNDCDIIASMHKYYIATDYDSTDGKYPLLGDAWIEGDYTLTDWGDAKPFLWTYEETTYINLGKNRKETKTTKPQIYQKYARGIKSITTYFYSGPEATGIGCEAVSDHWIVTGRINADPQTQLLWSKKNTGLGPELPYQWTFTVYEYSEGQISHSEPVLSATFSQDGKQGIVGCVINKTEWEAGKTYHNDMYYNPSNSSTIRYCDVVYLRENDKYYQMRPYAKKIGTDDEFVFTDDGIGAGTGEYYDDAFRNALPLYLIQVKPCDDEIIPSVTINPGTENEQTLKNVTNPWRVIEENAPMLTPLIIAQNAVFELAQGNEFLLMDSSSNIVGGLSGYQQANTENIRIFVGTQTPKEEYKYLNGLGNSSTGNQSPGIRDSSWTIAAVNRMYDKMMAPFRVYEDGTFAATDAYITGDLINKPGNCMFYTEIRNDEIQYKSKTGHAMAVFMPIMNPYQNISQYSNTTKWNNDLDQYIPGLVFFDPSGNVSSWIDYRGLHVSEHITVKDYEYNMQFNAYNLAETILQRGTIDTSAIAHTILDNLTVRLDVSALAKRILSYLPEDINWEIPINDADRECKFTIMPELPEDKDSRKCNISIKPDQSIPLNRWNTSIHGYYKNRTSYNRNDTELSDGPVSIITETMYNKCFEQFDVIQESFYMYPFPGYNHETMLMDTQYTMETVFSQNNQHITYYADRDSNGDIIKQPIVRRTVTAGTVSGTAGVPENILNAIGSIMGIGEILGNNLQFNIKAETYIDDELCNAKDLFGKVHRSECSDNYAHFIASTLSKFFNQYSESTNGGKDSIPAKQPYQVFANINGPIITLYQKRSARGIYYVDQQCTIKANSIKPDGYTIENHYTDCFLDFPMESVQAQTVAMKISTLYQWFDIEMPVVKSRAGLSDWFGGEMIGGNISADKIYDVQWAYNSHPSSMGYSEGLKLLSLLLYNSLYPPFPYMFKCQGYDERLKLQNQYVSAQDVPLKFINIKPNFIDISKYTFISGPNPNTGSKQQSSYEYAYIDNSLLDNKHLNHIYNLYWSETVDENNPKRIVSDRSYHYADPDTFFRIDALTQGYQYSLKWAMILMGDMLAFSSDKDPKFLATGDVKTRIKEIDDIAVENGQNKYFEGTVLVNPGGILKSAPSLDERLDPSTFIKTDGTIDPHRQKFVDSQYIFFRPQIYFENGYKKECITCWLGTYDPKHTTHDVYVVISPDDLVLNKVVPTWMDRFCNGITSIYGNHGGSGVIIGGGGYKKPQEVY